MNYKWRCFGGLDWRSSITSTLKTPLSDQQSPFVSTSCDRAGYPKVVYILLARMKTKLLSIYLSPA